MNLNTTSILFSMAVMALMFSLCFDGDLVAQDNKTAAPTRDAESKSDQEKSALHEKLAKYLTKTRWEGRFTMTGNDENTKPEYYEIISAEKGEVGDYWNLVARIKYGDKDATLPLPPIEIKFAGGTPVITVDQATFPGFGTFDARVVIRQGKYAGTWSHGDVGGHLFGTIKKIEESDSDKEESKSETPDK